MKDGRFRWISGLWVVGTALWAGLSTTDSYAGRPGWIKTVPEGACFEYFVGRDYSCASESKAERLATVDAWRQIVQNKSVEALQHMTGLTDVKDDKVIFETVKREIEVTGDATRVRGSR